MKCMAVGFNVVQLVEFDGSICIEFGFSLVHVVGNGGHSAMDVNGLVH